MNLQKSLIALAIGGFGIGMTEFVMMGLLPEIASDLSVSIPEAGYLISSYALGVVIGAPLLILMAGNFPPKKLLIGLMVLFTIFNGLSVIVPSYNLFLVTRLLSGLPHGAFFGVGAVVAGKLAKKGKEASAVAMMFSGLAFANIVGIPLGTYVGQSLSWRYSFLIVAIIGLLAIVALVFWMPNLEKNKNDNPKQGLKVFKHVEPWLVLLITAIGTGGFFAWFSYIKPLLTEVGDFETSTVTFILMGVGLGMTLGNFIGGKLADKISPVKAGMVLLFTMVACLLTIIWVAENQLLLLIMSFVTGAVAFSVIAPIQMLMIKSAKGAEMLASASMQAGFNIGNALGAFLGGIPIEKGLGYTSPQAVGAVLAFLGALICISVMWNRRRVDKKLAVNF
ncbi:MFS transporter [Mesonia aestuariivivens]|uniref:MFS transporter n=1 Tax=Mesonia aestuariivivens TaxID=2796128 RepID=A0ABS6VXT6_9FLAO|nr:MFS transporter [Mesonia aestuariivivens]MBW2960399.1 MFS transporter [Mesonia aestuariivivens]